MKNNGQDDHGVVDVLKHARLITEQQLERAREARQESGESLKDLLFREVSWDSIRQFLNYELPTPSGGEKRALAAALHQAGWVSEKQLDEAARDAKATGEALGRKLVEQKIITEEQLDAAVKQQQETGLPLWRTLMNLGFVSAKELSQTLGIGDLPVETEQGPAGQTHVAKKRGKPAAEPRVVAQKSVVAQPRDVKSMSAVRLVEAIIDSAVKSRATDIHLDPQHEHMRVRFRIDSMLYDVMQLPLAIVPEVTSRLKVLGGMDITQHRTALEGHFVRRVGDVDVDLRLESAPTVLGEKLVLRILNEETVLTGIAQLGLEPQQMELMEILMAKPYGMILATGPVGAGKTTTLYALLNEINILSKNVMTIEDPVEYRLRGVNQMQVDAGAGFGFVEGLRAILRQDPNIIMVGEIRDEETAATAVRAAITGVLVLSTLHANDAPGAVSSLVGLNVPRFLISSAVIGVVSQRLVRKICVHCKEPYQPEKGLLERLGLADGHHDKPFYHGVGCEKCFHTGYFGRTGVFEVMGVGEQLKEAIFAGKSRAEIRQLAIEGGMQTLAQSALNRVLDGTTTAEEFLRVIFT